jgi:glycerol-3-phosphate O-acyltransferase
VLLNFLESYRIAARSLGALLDRPQADKELTRRALSTGEHMFLDGEIQRWEAISKPIFASAYAALGDRGYVIHRDGKYHAGPELRSEASIAALEKQLMSYLPRQKA